MNGRIKLSSSRRAIAGMLRYSQRIPTIPVARRMRLGEVAAARARLPLPPSWSAIFIRAYGIVCTRFAHLRRSWISWPSPYLYEHPHSVCAVAVERDWQGERAVLMGRIVQPESAKLDLVQRRLQHYQLADVWSIGDYRMTLRFGRLPAFLQRLMMWLKLDLCGPRRVKYVGTFGMTNYGQLGAESLHPLGPQTTVMTLGPLSSSGDMTVKLVYDHRVLDGAYVARCLNHLEEVLHTSILAELTERAPAGSADSTGGLQIADCRLQI